MILLNVLFLLGLQSLVHCRGQKYGAFIGSLPNLMHNVSGTVYAPSEDQIFIKGLYYDGLGPATHFWIGTQGSEPNENGIILRYPRSNTNNNDDDPIILPRFADEDVLLDLPEGTTITQFKWFSIWCTQFTVSFGHVFIPEDLEVPKKSAPTPQCLDQKPECVNWAKEGECKKNPVWMRPNCPASCELCGKEVKCLDSYKECAIWKKEGLCTSADNHIWMFFNCPVTCGKCGIKFGPV